jgi:CRISPR/Cas system CSM-associated protein Csm3 (group 7 of RAMP superfamily)
LALTGNSPYLKWLRERPVRDHVRINHRGAADAKGSGKFDNEVVPKGVRFRFALELVGGPEDGENWQAILAALQAPTFRVGGGTRKGYGRLRVDADHSETLSLDLTKPEDLRRYLDISSSLSSTLNGIEMTDTVPRATGWHTYHLDLKPDGFWLFGSGLPDEDADMAPLVESVVTWEDGRNPSFNKKHLVIPASAIKGAVSHRTAFHYNRIKGIFADKLTPEEIEEHVGESNPAVRALFGSVKDSTEKDVAHAGRVYFTDIFIPYEPARDSKIMNHVSIDRFTGGALDGALFDERVIGACPSIRMDIPVESAALEDLDIQKAFKAALTDVCSGALPLGGGVMRGHGVFTGTLTMVAAVAAQEANHG